MKNIKRNIISGVILLLGLYLSTLSVSAEIATVDQVTINPEEPELLSTVNFTADITGDDISTVNLIVGECDDVTGVCYKYHRVTMTKLPTGEYQAEVTLASSKATYIYCEFLITNSSGFSEQIKDDSWKFNLSIEADGTNGGADTNESPGFELVLMLVSIVVVVFLIYRKREK